MIDIATRAGHIAGTTPNPDSSFMARVARNLSDCVAGFLQGKRFLILDRDSKFLKSNCLRKMILFGASSLERAIRKHVDHYHEERNRRGLGNELIRGDAESELAVVEVRKRLGGLLKY